MALDNQNQQTTQAQDACPNCGMARAEWQGNNGNGFEMGDQTYCCQGCAVGTGCTCQ